MTPFGSQQPVQIPTEELPAAAVRKTLIIRKKDPIIQQHVQVAGQTPTDEQVGFSAQKILAGQIVADVARPSLVLRSPIGETVDADFHVPQPIEIAISTTIFEWTDRTAEANELQVRQQGSKTNTGIHVTESEKTAVDRSG